MPHVTPIDHTGRQHSPLGPFREQRIQLTGGTDEIDVQSVDRQGKRRIEILAESREVGRDEEPQFAGARGERLVRPPIRRALGIATVERKARLVELHPLRTRSCERLQHVAVHRQQPVE